MLSEFFQYQTYQGYLQVVVLGALAFLSSVPEKCGTRADASPIRRVRVSVLRRDCPRIHLGQKTHSARRRLVIARRGAG